MFEFLEDNKEDSEDEEDLDTPDESQSDLELQEQQEMEIALYSQLHFISNEDIDTKVSSKDNIYDIDVFQDSGNKKNSIRGIIQTSSKSFKNIYREDYEKDLDSVKLTQDSINSNAIQKLETESKNSVSNPILVDSVSGESEISDSSEVDTDQLEIDSDLMILDETISDMDDIDVHVNNGQKKMLRKLTQQLGEEEIEDANKWHIIERDRYSVSKLSKRYYGTISVRCNNCRDIGHLSRDCPKPQKNMICFLCGFTGHNNRTCPNGVCYNCEGIGHIAKECPGPRRSRYIECHRCSMYGHAQVECPDNWRQFHMTTIPNTLRKTSNKENRKMYCYNCASNKHFGYNCPEDRIDKHGQPSYPFVAVYRQVKNVEYDTRKRKRDYVESDEDEDDHRTKKVKYELRDKKYTSFASRIKEKIKSTRASNSYQKESQKPVDSKKSDIYFKKPKDKTVVNEDFPRSNSRMDSNKDGASKEQRTITFYKDSDNEFKHQAFDNNWWEKKQDKNKKKKKKSKKPKGKKGTISQGKPSQNNPNERQNQKPNDRQIKIPDARNSQNPNNRQVQKTSRGFKISFNTKNEHFRFKR